jgi:hypothetical protein
MLARAGAASVSIRSRRVDAAAASRSAALS